MMRIAYIADSSPPKEPKRKRPTKKTFYQLAAEAMEHKRAVDRVKAIEKNADKINELNQLKNKLLSLKQKKNEKLLHQSKV